MERQPPSRYSLLKMTTYPLRKIFASTLILVNLLNTVQAGLLDDDEARRAILDLREKVNNFQATTVDRFEKNNQSLLDLQNQLTQLKEEYSKLRGQNEILQNDIKQLQQALQNYYQDLNERLKKIEPKQIEIDGQRGSVLPAESIDYEIALKFFHKNDIKNALYAFQNFSKRYPESIYLPLAQFWIGNIFYAQRNYKDAITTLHNMIRKFPQHPKVADAWTVIGSCQSESGQKQQARKTFSIVITQYPESEAASLAKQRLKDLK